MGLPGAGKTTLADALAKKIDNLVAKNKWEKIDFFKSNYLSSKDVNAWLGIYKVTKQ